MPCQFVALCGAGRPCVLFETPHIAMSMQAFSPTPKPKLLQAVRDVAKAHSMTKVSDDQEVEAGRQQASRRLTRP